MLDTPVYAATAILLLIAVSEVVSIITKAYVPSLLVAIVGYLLLIWTGVFPADLLPASTLAAVGSLLIGAVITHMGTLIPLSQIRSQYKAILIALAGVVVATLLLLAIITPFFGYDHAVAGAGPVTGGIIAYVLTADELQALGLNSLVVIPAIILGLQSLLGIPLANVLLRKYATRIRAANLVRRETATADTGPGDSFAVPEEVPVLLGGGEPQSPRRGLQLIPERFQQTAVLLLLLFVGASLATWLGSVTGINYSIFALFLGLGGRLLGLFPERSMERANSFGFGMLAVIIVVLASMSSVTWADVVRAIGPVIVILVVGAIGIMIGGAVVSRLLKWDMYKGMPVALTAMFGFPGDFMLCQEISRSVGRTEQERKEILDEILTPMLVGGFTTVTTSSILVASILVTTL